MTALCGKLASVLVLATIACGLVVGSARGDDPLAHASIGFEPTPLTLATDAAGHVFLSNPQSPRQIDEYSPDGTLLGSAELRNRTRAIAMDPEGDLWVAAAGAPSVTEFTRGGKVLRSWGAEGLGIAIAADADVYTVGPNGVAHDSPDGTLISKWSLGSGAGQAWGIAVGPEGLI
jgi:hypothetical protein